MKPAFAYKILLVLALVLLVGYWWKGAVWLLYVMAALLLAGAISEPWAISIGLGWMLLAKALGWINTRVFLTLIYFLILTPIAYLQRLFQKEDAFRLKKPEKTNWISKKDRHNLEDTW